MIHTYCPDATPVFFGLLDFSIAPPFLYWAYIPLVLSVLIISAFVYRASGNSLESRALCIVALSYALWVGSVILQWIAAPIALVMFAWEITYFFELSVFIATFYFVYIFLTKQAMPMMDIAKLLLIIVPTTILMPTAFNITYFNLTHCEAVPNAVQTYVQIMQLFIIAGITNFAVRHIRERRKEGASIRNSPEMYVAIGAVSFLICFSLASYIASQMGNWKIEMVGAGGIAIFIALLGYVIVRFKTFNIKLLATEALVAALAVVIFSQFFIRSITTYRYVTVFTFVAVIFIGLSLIKSVRWEVSEREKSEELAQRLALANSRLKEIDRIKTDFVSIASHQMRSPLTAITGYASLIIEGTYGPVSRNIKETVTKIYQSGKLMSVIIDDFLNVTRIEQGRMKYTLSTFNIVPIVKTVVEDMTFVASGKHLALTYEGPAEELWTYADQDKMKQVVTNLIDNAIKYTPSGSVVVSVAPHENEIAIRVKDTGIGIPEENKETVFMKFTRAENANSANVSGTGLGLFIAKKFVEHFNGRIWFDSEAGKGTTFTIVLPRITVPIKKTVVIG